MSSKATASISSASIDASAHSDLSSGAKRFIAVWDAYLAANAVQLRAARQALSGAEPVFNEFQALLRAAYDTARLRSTVQFDKARRKFFNDARPLFTRIQNTLKEVTAQPTDRKLRDLVNHNQEAQAIVKKVNQSYPSGSLAQEFKTG